MLTSWKLRVERRPSRGRSESRAGPYPLRHRGIELARLVDERLVAGVLEPDELLRRCAQCLEIRHAGLWRNPVILATEEEERRHLQCGHEFDEIQARDLRPHRIHREPEPAPSAGQLEDR